MSKSPPEKDRGTLCEELEPRLLMSADAAGVLLDPGLAEDALAGDATAHRQLLDIVESQQLLQSDVRRELVFVDPGVEGTAQLLEDLRARSDGKLELEVRLLDAERDGVEQIASALAEYDDLDAVHVVSHGRQGALQLGNGWLTAESLDSQAGLLASWGDALTSDGDLLFYGCDLAGSEGGAALVDGLGRLTGADVAASVDVTGSALLGGDWELEHRTGAIETASALDETAQWRGRLAVAESQEIVDLKVEVWSSSQSWGQSFSHTSGNGTYDVTSVSLHLTDVNSTPGQQVTISLRETWDGPVLSSQTLSASTFSSAGDWVAFDMGGETLNDGQTYIIRTDASQPSGKVYIGYSVTDTYTSGTRLEDAGASVSGDLAFRVSTTTPSTVPVLGAIETGALSYTENDGPVPITDTITVGDPGGGTLSGAAISIIGNYANGEDLLGFTDTANISGSWDGLGTLFLSGDASASEYEAALRSVTYENTSESPSTATRTIGFVVLDGLLPSSGASRAVDVETVADTPTVTDATTTVDTQTTTGLVITPNAGDGPEVTHFKITGITDGTLYLNDGTTQVNDGDFITVAQGAAGLRFTPAAGSVVDGSFGVQASLAANDGGLGGNVAFANITVDATTGTPPIADQGFAVDENAADGTVVGTVVAGDVDLVEYLGFSEAKELEGDASSLTISTPAGVSQGDLLIAAVAVDKNYLLSLDAPSGEGWNFVVAGRTSNQVTMGIWWKNVDASESSSHTFTWAANERAYGWIMHFTGHDGVAPIDAFSVLGGDSASPLAPSVAASVDNALILRLGAFEADDVNVDAPGLDTHTPITMDEANNVSGGAGFEIQPLAGSSGTASFDLTNSRHWLTVTLAIAPEAGGPLSYAITGGNADGAFAIDAANGEITVADGSLLDFESTPSRSLTVEVTDGGGLSASATVTVDLNDLNEAPSVSGGPFALDENSANGTVVGSVTASDPDTADTLSYAIIGGDPDGAFAIDASGVIRVADASKLDFETTPSFDLQVQVTDDGTPAMLASATVRVNLNDLNEAPTVSGGPFALDENSANGTVVGSVTASDPDTADTLSYAIIGGDPDGAFAIDASGVIRVADASRLDFETTPSFDLQVQVTDDGTPAMLASATVRVNLNDLNEAPSVSGGPFALDENSANGTVVGSVTASDPDTADSLSYAIIGGDPDGAFAIDGSGVIRVADASKLDFETTSSFDLQVQVTDDGTPAMLASATVRVNLNDLNEAPSVSGGPFALDENSANGTVVGSVTASDPDTADSLSYAIIGGDPDGAFAIDGSGVIRVADASKLDFETTSSFDLQVQVTDDGTPAMLASATVRVNLNDLNEAPTVSGGPFTVAEDSTDGTAVGSVLASDPDPGDSLGYAIVGGDPDGAFSIDASGVIRVADSSKLDFETTPSYDLQVQVTDDGTPPLSTLRVVRVGVTDVNEAPTVSGGPFGLSETSLDGTVVGSVGASDPDTGDTLSYAIVGGDPDGVFSIDAGGVIRVADATTLDFETTPSYDLQVQVTDDGTPTLSGSATVRVDVTNQNEAPTVSGGPFGLAENSADGTVVGSVSASDPDTGDTLSYAIVGGDPGGAFSIDGSGVIRVADGSQLDFETAPFYDLQVQVTDDGTPPLSASTTVRVNLGGVNEAPTIAGGVLSVGEDASDGDGLGNLGGSDPDLGDSLSYSIVAGDSGGAFSVDASGNLRVADASQLDFETTPFYDLTVQVRDDGTPALSDSAIVRVNVLDVNEAPSAPNGNFSVDEESAVGTFAGSIAGTDPDTSDTLSYRIVSGNTGNAFSIDPVSGNLTVADPTVLDFETNPIFNLQVEIRDDGAPSLSSTIDVTVQLIDALELPVPVPVPGPIDPPPEPESEPPPEELPPVEEIVPTTPLDVSPIDLPGGETDLPDEPNLAGPRSDTAVREAQTTPASAERDQIERSRYEPGDPQGLETFDSSLPLASQIFADARTDFLEELERVRQEVVAAEGFESAVTGSSFSLAAGLSVGYVLLLTRGGLLIASLVSSMPAWRLIDPLPVLSRLGNQQHDGDAETLDSMVSGGIPAPEPADQAPAGEAGDPEAPGEGPATPAGGGSA